MNLYFKIQKLLTVGHIREGGRNPFVDWMAILIVSTLVSIAMISGGIYLYNQVVNGEISSKEKASERKLVTFDTKNLNYFIEKFNTKLEISDSVKREYKGKADPSI
jgi:hypothetical protein